MHATFITTFLLATVTSVSALCLSDLDQIPADTVTPGCLTVYGEEITACPDAADFQAKTACSPECVAALNTFSQGVILACRQAFVSPGSLLRKVLDGGLATTLCPAPFSPSSYASVSESATSTTAYSPSTAAVKPARIQAESVTSTTTLLPSTISFSGFLTITTSADSASRIPSALTLDESAEPTVSSGVPALEVETSSTTSASKSVQTPALTTSGNGSPFESSAGTTTTSSQQNAAGSVKAVLATVMISVSVALGAAFL